MKITQTHSVKRTIEVPRIFYVFFTLLLVFLFSCKKTTLTKETTKLVEVKNVGIGNINLEKVDISLLNKYISYKSSLQSDFLINRSTGGHKYSKTSILSNKEFDLMIDNYLVNQRNTMRLNYFLTRIKKGGDATNYRDTVVLPDVVIRCTGEVAASSITAVVLQATITGGGSVISDYSFSFTGVHGIMEPIGTDIDQSVYNGVITFRKDFTETIELSNGVKYTQVWTLYGNIYNGSCIVAGISNTGLVQ